MSDNPYANVVIGGKLKLGKKKKKSKKRQADMVTLNTTSNEGANAGSKDEASDLTQSQQRFLKRQRATIPEKAKNHVKVSHRERVDALNDKLGSMTEMNDVPRISAMGNG